MVKGMTMTEEEALKARTVIRESLRMNKVCSNKEIEKIVNKVVSDADKPNTIKKINQNIPNIKKAIYWAIALWFMLIPCELFFYMAIFSSSYILSVGSLLDIIIIFATMMLFIVLFMVCCIPAIMVYDKLQIYAASYCKLISFLCVIFWVRSIMPEAEKWLQYFL